MSRSLTKGANVALSAVAAVEPRRVLVGLGWTPPAGEFQLDLSVLLLGEDGKVPSSDHVVFASQLQPASSGTTTDGAVVGEDDEQLEVDLSAVPAYVQRIVFSAAIYNAAARRQTFGQIEHLFIRVTDLDGGSADGTELVRYVLDHDCAGETALAFGELYRHSGGWKFRAVGQGWSDGLASLTRDYGAAG